MANKFTTKVTNEGVTLLQEASQQDKKVEFINAIASSTAYSESQLISETYDDINGRASKNQTGTINNITIGKNITRMELVFDGHDVKSDYTLNSIFLIAKLKDSQDLKLFAVIKANQPQYMNSYDGSGSTNLQINLGIKFSNNDRVTLQVDTAAIATLGDLSKLRNETQTKLDDFVGKESAKLSNMSEAILSLKVISKTVSVDRINARSNVTVTVDVDFRTGYTSQLASLSVLVCSNPNASVTDFWFYDLSKKLYVLIENPTTDVITNMKLFCKIPTFKNSNLI